MIYLMGCYMQQFVDVFEYLVFVVFLVMVFSVGENFELMWVFNVWWYDVVFEFFKEILVGIEVFKFNFILGCKK